MKGPVKESPLAGADTQTTSDRDFMTTQIRFPDRIGENYALDYNPGRTMFQLEVQVICGIAWGAHAP